MRLAVVIALLALAGCGASPPPCCRAPAVELIVEGNRGLGDRAVAAARAELAPLSAGPLAYYDAYEQASRAHEALEQAYADAGFIDRRVGAADIRLSPDRATVLVRFAVEEGPRYRVGSNRVEEIAPVGAAPPGLAPAAVPGLRTGDWFSRAAVADALDGLRRRYRDAGYLTAQVLPETRMDLDARRIDLSVWIEPGAVHVVAAVEVIDADRGLRPVPREIDLRLGETWSESRVERARVQLSRRFADREVEVRSEPIPAEPGRARVRFLVLPREPAPRP